MAGNTTLLANGGNLFNVAGPIGGTGNLTLISPTGNTFIFAANNTYVGGTTVANGTLQIGTGGTAGSVGTGTIIDNGNVVVNVSGNATIAGISGTGNFMQAGTGTTTLMSTSLTSGSTAVNAGMLAFNLAGNATLAGNISGNGNLGVTVSNGALTLVNMTGSIGMLTATADNGMNVASTLNATNGVVLTTKAGNLTVGGNISASSGNITLTAGASCSIGQASGYDTCGDVVPSAGFIATAGAGKTVVIRSGNANSAALRGLVSGATYYKVFNTSGTTPDSNYAIDLFYRSLPVISGNGTAQSRGYDGTVFVNATLVAFSGTGIFDQDTYTYSFAGGSTNGTIGDTHVGTNKLVAVAPSTLNVTGTASSNSLVANYNPVVYVGNVMVNITPAGLTVAASGGTKVYDGLNGSVAVATVTGLKGSDTVSNASLAEVYASPHVQGSNGSVLNVAAALGNASLGGGGYVTDYNVSYVAANGTITPATVTLSGGNGEQQGL
ncbi:beta strand repeat-containing protein [Cupriavidus sp. D39]|uniref:beta strand repeat-containing protein n=1 Tax=Cupriavidus sp. D39 TaxID=2997877 RepID=UPI00226D4AE8|nr:hypothetical protein [Cupriavidus sp. D39]MCY0858735.1 hypothetical protein [Cupriavidus sp. D39]